MQSNFGNPTKKGTQVSLEDIANSLKFLTYFDKTSSLTVAMIIDSVYPSPFTEENVQKFSSLKNQTPEEIRGSWKRFQQEGIEVHKAYQDKLIKENEVKCHVNTEFPVIFKSFFSGSIDGLLIQERDDTYQFKIIEIKTTNDLIFFFKHNVEKTFFQLLLYKEMLRWMLNEIGINKYEISIEIHLIDRNAFYTEKKLLEPLIIASYTKKVMSIEINQFTMQNRLKLLIIKLMNSLNLMANQRLYAATATVSLFYYNDVFVYS